MSATARRRRRRQLRVRSSRAIALGFILLVFGFLFLPIVVTVLFAFASSQNLSFPIHGLTLHWFDVALNDSLAVPALETSLKLAAVTSVIAGFCGTAAALGANRFRPRARERIGYAALMPAIAPPLVLGVALAVGFHATGIVLGFTTALAAHVMITIPFVFLIVRSRIEAFDWSSLEAARDLGATAKRAFWDVTLALIRPAVLSAALISLSLSLDEFVVTSFTIGAGQTLPLLLWARMRTGITPEVNALATVILCGTVSTGLLAYRASRLRL